MQISDTVISQISNDFEIVGFLPRPETDFLFIANLGGKRILRTASGEMVCDRVLDFAGGMRWKSPIVVVNTGKQYQILEGLARVAEFGYVGRTRISSNGDWWMCEVSDNPVSGVRKLCFSGKVLAPLGQEIYPITATGRGAVFVVKNEDNTQTLYVGEHAIIKGDEFARITADASERLLFWRLNDQSWEMRREDVLLGVSDGISLPHSEYSVDLKGVPSFWAQRASGYVLCHGDAEELPVSELAPGYNPPIMMSNDWVYRKLRGGKVVLCSGTSEIVSADAIGMVAQEHKRKELIAKARTGNHEGVYVDGKFAFESGVLKPHQPATDGRFLDDTPVVSPLKGKLACVGFDNGQERVIADGLCVAQGRGISSAPRWFSSEGKDHLFSGVVHSRDKESFYVDHNEIVSASRIFGDSDRDASRVSSWRPYLVDGRASIFYQSSDGKTMRLLACA